MGADLRPAELAEEYLYKPGRLDRSRREDAEAEVRGAVERLQG